MSFIPQMGNATSLKTGVIQLSGDLTGSASSPQIAASAVTAAKLADSSVSESKLLAANSPMTGQVLSWNGTSLAWVASSGTGAIYTAEIVTTPGGTITRTIGSSATLLKLKATLTSNLTIILSGSTVNQWFDFSFIDTTFNGFTITIGTDIFSYPTFVRYCYIESSWERII